METEPTFRDMAQGLEARFRKGAPEAWTDADFEAWAHRIFSYQYERCAPYQALCRTRGVTPDGVAAWQEVPAVPATAFKYFDLVSRTGPPDVVFRTSGTTRGSERRGRHLVPRLDLYRASLLEPFRRALLGDVGMEEIASIPFLSLIPSPDEAPASSLSFMVASAAEQLGARVFWLVSGDGAWRWDAVEDARAPLAEEDGPALLLGTALSFGHLVREVRGGHAALGGLMREVPDGSRAMETGGFKGAREEVSRSELYRGIQEVTGIPRQRIVNEYGMTELLSQLWEAVLLEGPDARGLHRPPPWLRVQALDPTTLAARPEGEPGLLAFFDLANVGSIAHVLTEDVGSIEGGHVRLAGRAAGAEPRGCSRALDDLMSAASADGG